MPVMSEMRTYDVRDDARDEEGLLVLVGAFLEQSQDIMNEMK